ncbi:hypothetical protein IWW57_002689 [Coemansia sp. S610]|nr:hypothetical protein IWW57_002689 [Coemansia sp. S610]
MTPAATGLNIVFCSYSSTIEESRGQCSNLVQQPCSRNISRLQVESRTDYDLSSLDLHSLSGLTSIAQGFTTAYAPFAHVAYRSADTLRELSLVCLEEDDWRTLLYGGSNIPAVYSRLTKLLLGFEDDEESMNWAAIDGAVFFPALSEMTLEDDYPFGDELLFRGNRPTLRKLHIPFRMPAKNAFGRCNVFNCSGATWMSLIDVGPLDPSDEDRVVGQSDAQVMQKFRSILEATMTFSLNGAVAAKYLLRALEPTASAAVLHELRLYERPLCASKALSIISAILSLVTLSGAIYQPVSNVKSIRAREHLRALRRKYPIDNSNFRRLNVLKGENDLADSAGDDFDICHNASAGNAWLHYKMDKFTRKIAVVAVKIAALCPNFSHVVLPKEIRGEFSREVALAMTNGPFMPYANRLSRLIYPE